MQPVPSTIVSRPSRSSSLTPQIIAYVWSGHAYHIAENAAIRQNLGHAGLPDFVGDIDSEAPYRAEAAG